MLERREKEIEEREVEFGVEVGQKERGREIQLAPCLGSIFKMVFSFLFLPFSLLNECCYYYKLLEVLCMRSLGLA